jgi:aspartyl-tRNA(Asn)/glutamyl-tRNA(Gln) amidotransferase subunit C
MVTRDEVIRIAALAKLQFSEDELDEFTNQFNQILEHMNTLNELDTENVEPLSHPVEGENVTRTDEVKGSIPQYDALKNAPDTDGTYFRVPKIIKTEK